MEEPETKKQLNGFVGKDQGRKCGGFGHCADTCTKAKGKEGDKGAGKSKGPATGCWSCGGDHFQDQCLKVQHASKGGGKKGNDGPQSYFGKGSGKGYKGDGKGSKGKGSGLHQLHVDRSNYEYDPWGASWESGAFSVSCLRTVAPPEQACPITRTC